MTKFTFALACLCFCSSLTFANSIGNPFTTSDQVLEERINSIDAQVDMRLTNLARTKIIEYTNYKPGAKKILKKSQLYFPIFERQLKKYNVPEEFKYLPIIESNLSTTIRSKAGAVGLWQFIKSTGQAYGLQIGALIDERMDPEKSSEAAAKYLHNLYQEFNDWTLVLAAYNSGAGGVRKAIKKAGSNSYWDVYEYLPRETRSYLPKFVAAAYLSNYYQHHGIDTQFAESDLLNTITAKIFEEIDFTTIAQESGTTIEIIETLNPEYIKGFIPQSNGDYQLTLPSNSMSTFVTNNYSAQIVVASLPNYLKRDVVNTTQIKSNTYTALVSIKEINKWSFTIPVFESYSLYKLGKRETLSMVAKKCNISLSELLTINSLEASNSNQLLPKHIKIPTSH